MFLKNNNHELNRNSNFEIYLYDWKVFSKWIPLTHECWHWVCGGQRAKVRQWGRTLHPLHPPGCLRSCLWPVNVWKYIEIKSKVYKGRKKKWGILKSRKDIKHLYKKINNNFDDKRKNVKEAKTPKGWKKRSFWTKHVKSDFKIKHEKRNGMNIITNDRNKDLNAHLKVD